MSDLIEDFIRCKHAAGLSENTLQAYRADLLHFAASLNGKSLAEADIE
ncbi:MAG: hypothetical protein FWD08_07560 [Alphaproteobacteria bacterium]|nr:hypothetical protein [Alphaproteobacteria bacterium]